MKKLLKQLIKNGQIATQYVDFEGNVSLDMPFNPNGSMLWNRRYNKSRWKSIW